MQDEEQRIPQHIPAYIYIGERAFILDEIWSGVARC